MKKTNSFNSLLFPNNPTLLIAAATPPPSSSSSSCRSLEAGRSSSKKCQESHPRPMIFFTSSLPFFFLLLELLICLHSSSSPFFVEGLECYSGFALIRGQSVGTSKQTCKKDTDQCYNTSVALTSFSQLKMAGCSTYRCMVRGCL